MQFLNVAISEFISEISYFCLSLKSLFSHEKIHRSPYWQTSNKHKEELSLFVLTNDFNFHALMLPDEMLKVCQINYRIITGMHMNMCIKSHRSKVRYFSLNQSSEAIHRPRHWSRIASVRPLTVHLTHYRKTLILMLCPLKHVHEKQVTTPSERENLNFKLETTAKRWKPWPSQCW